MTTARRWVAALPLVLTALLPATAGAAPRPGTPDSAFGKGGRVVADFDSEPARTGIAEQVIPTADGGLLAFSFGSITRYGPDGSVDRGFGLDGSIVRVVEPIAMTTDSQGRIVVASSSEEPSAKVTLERFSPNGTLDRSFGRNGARTVPVAEGRIGKISTILIEPDGKFLLVGGASGDRAGSIGAMRLLPSGAVDRGYGKDGCASLKLPYEVLNEEVEPAAALDGENLVLAIWGSEPNLLVVRFGPSGRLDPGFGSGGVVHANLLGGTVAGVAAGGDGRITVLAAADGVARLLPDGTPDPSFGKGGSVIPEHPLSNPAGLIVEADGSTLVAGTVTGEEKSTAFALERLRPDGTRDPSFGGGAGYVISSLGAPGGEVRAEGIVALPGRGTLVYGGAPLPGGPSSYEATGIALFGPDGALAGGFGVGGVLNSQPPTKSNDFGSDLLVQGNGGVVVTGRGAGRSLLTRYRADGSRDARFHGGEPTLPASGSYFGDEGKALASVPGGGFLLGTGSAAGGGLFRFGENGGTDAGFGDGGEARTPGLEQINDLAVTEDGSIWAAGFRVPHCEAALARFLPEGQLDRSAGDAGLRRIRFGAGACRYRELKDTPRGDGVIVAAAGELEGFSGDAATGRGLIPVQVADSTPMLPRRIRAIALDSRGRILIAGKVKSGLAVERLTPAGRPDPSFGDGGEAHVDIGRAAQAADLELEPDGSILLAGRTNLCRPHTPCYGVSPFVARLEPDGRPDRGFGTAGFWTGKPGAASGIKAIALAPGAIYATGWTTRPHTSQDLLLMRLRR